MKKELLKLIKKAKLHKLTAEEIRQQKISFVYGSVGKHNTMTKEQIGKIIDEKEGRIH